MSVIFEDNSKIVIQDIENKSIKFLHEAKDSVSAQASRNSPVDTSALKQSFQNDSMVDEAHLTAHIGSTLEYAIYQELGTGEYALNENGREGSWVYMDKKTGKFHRTTGVKPQRMLHNAYISKKQKIINRAQEIFGEL